MAMIPGLGIIQSLEQGLPLSPPVLKDPGGLGINPVSEDTSMVERLLLMLLLQGGFDPNALSGVQNPLLGSQSATQPFSQVFGGFGKKKGGPPPP